MEMESATMLNPSKEVRQDAKSSADTNMLQHHVADYKVEGVGSV
jgi:hypothetical protein